MPGTSIALVTAIAITGGLGVNLFARRRHVPPRRTWTLTFLTLVVLAAASGFLAHSVQDDQQPTDDASTSEPATAEPEPSATAEQEPSATQETSLPGEKRYSLTLPDRSYVDLDTSTVQAKEFSSYDVRLEQGRLHPAKNVEFVIIANSQVTGSAGCAQGTKVYRTAVRLAGLEEAESLCVRSAKGQWAVLRVDDDGSSGLASSATIFTVRLFHS